MSIFDISECRQINQIAEKQVRRGSQNAQKQEFSDLNDFVETLALWLKIAKLAIFIAFALGFSSPQKVSIGTFWGTPE